MAFNKGPSLAERMKKKIGQSQETPQDEAGTPSLEDIPQEKPSAVKAGNAAEIINTQQALGNIDKSVVFIDLELIDIEEQVRKQFDEDYIFDLAVDFALSRTKQPNQPITVWKRPNGRYLLDDGENRLRAMKIASENRKELKITNLTAFTQIRATVRGDEPSKLDRIQSQAKANLLRDNLSEIEIGEAAKLFLENNKDKTHTDVAKWLGFQKLGSGRVKVSNSLKLLTADKDLIESVASGAIGARKALEIQDTRTRENTLAGKHKTSNNETTPTNKKSVADFEKSKSNKKSIALNVDLEALKTAAKLLEHLAADKGMEINWSSKDLDRKGIMAIFKQDALQTMLDKLNG